MEIKDYSQLSGFIFMCNKRTMKECFHHKLFGLPYGSWKMVSQVTPGTLLFLFEYEARKMWGIYEAVSNGQLNINPRAYSKGSFPAQVRITEVESCLPLEEHEFKDAIRDNYFTDMKFKFDLSCDQVYRLCKAFLWKKLANNLETECELPPRLQKGYQLNNASSIVDLNSFSTGSQSQSWFLADDDENKILIPRKLPSGSFVNDYDEGYATGMGVCSPNRKSNIPNGSALETARLANGSSVEHSCSVYPQRQFCATTKDDETVIDEYGEECSLHADRLKYKPSVWSRISGRVRSDVESEPRSKTPTMEAPYAIEQRYTNERLETLESSTSEERHGMSVSSRLVCTQAVSEGSLSSVQDDVSPVDINFRRRKIPRDVGIVSEGHQKKRRKLTRPDFSKDVYNEFPSGDLSEDAKTLSLKISGDLPEDANMLSSRTSGDLPDDVKLNSSENRVIDYDGEAEEATGLATHKFGILLDTNKPQMNSHVRAENMDHEMGSLDLNQPIQSDSDLTEASPFQACEFEICNPCLQLDLCMGIGRSVA